MWNDARSCHPLHLVDRERLHRALGGGHAGGEVGRLRVRASQVAALPRLVKQEVPGVRVIAVQVVADAAGLGAGRVDQLGQLGMDEGAATLRGADVGDDGERHGRGSPCGRRGRAGRGACPMAEQARMFRSARHPMDAVGPGVTVGADADRVPPFRRYDCSAGCPVEAALEVFGGKWKGLALHHLAGGTRRFDERKRLCGTVTQRMPAEQLRELEADGSISRTVHPVVPPHVAYAPTPKGEAPVPVLHALREWGAAHAMPGRADGGASDVAR